MARKTRQFGSPNGDVALCELHKVERLEQGEKLGVPAAAGAYMMGLKPWPTGEEPCVDCEKREVTK